MEGQTEKAIKIAESTFDLKPKEKDTQLGSTMALTDAYGKKYQTTKDLNLVRVKQMNELYDTVEGLQVCSIAFTL